MADMTRIKGRIQEVIRPNGVGAITAAEHQSLLLEMVDDINTKKADQSELIATQESLEALTDTVNNLPQGNEFDKQGNYPLLHVGTADDLAGRGESVPAEFGFRASGGKSIKDGRAYIKRIKGNSVVWNQKLENGDFSQGTKGWYAVNGNSFVVEDGVATITLEGAPTSGAYVYLLSTSGYKYIVGHKYLISAEGNIPRQTTLEIQSSRLSLLTPSVVTPSINTWTRVAVIGEGIKNESGTFAFFARQTVGGWEAGDQYKVRNYQIIDLTQMFGAGNEPTTIEEFYQRIPKGIDLNAYNEGQVIHCNTESIKSVGDNAWDGSLFDGYVSDNTGAIVPNTKGKYTGFVRVLPNTQYYIRTDATSGRWGAWYDKDENYISGFGGVGPHKSPSNAAYMRMTIVYNNDGNPDTFGIYLVHSGWKQDTDAGYQPYWQDTLPLPIIRKYFPDGMKSAGTAHDEIRYNKASGKWEAVQRIGEVDLGTLSWRLGSGRMIASANFASASHSANAKVGNILTQKYMTLPYNSYSLPSVYTGSTGIAILKDSGEYYLSVYDSAYTDAASFKADMSGVMLYYELAEPIVTELDAEDQNFRDYYNVADFGTEMSQSSVPSAPFSADIIYQFNAVDMIREHEIEITELQSIITEQQSVIATMQAQLTSLINGGQ